MAGDPKALFGSGGAVDDLFGAFGSFEQAKGYGASAKAYRAAAGIAEENKQITAESTGIQLANAQRSITQTLGAQQAQVGAAGLEASGSATDLLRSSVTQGALTKNLIGLQGSINENAYEAEAQAALGQAAAADAAATASKGSGIGGIIKGAFEIGSMFLSDMRIKYDIRPVSTLPNGITRFSFRYQGDPKATLWLGLIAQNVREYMPDAVTKDPDTGLWQVDYGAADPEMSYPREYGHA